MKTSIKVIYWIPRILCILAIMFISMFALDSFTAGQSIWQQLGAFAMHLIPSFILIFLLIVAWKWQLIGGVIFIMLGLGFTPFIYTHNYMMNHSVWMSFSIVLMITFPFVVVGVLFIVSHFLIRKNLNQV